MGIQPVRDVVLIRHAYVAPGCQRGGVGGALLDAARAHDDAAAARRHVGGRRVGDRLLSPARVRARQPEPGRAAARYWDIPERQIETSVVLARPAAERPVA